MTRVVLGVSGGIAAYKACELLRRFTESGHDVTVVPTRAALEFVGAATWAALSGKPVSADVWESVHEVPHVRIGQGADLVVVAPATADLLAKAAHGLADDLLTNTLLTARCPVCIAGAKTTGHRAVSRVLVSRSSARPWAARAIRSAVAGATTTRSASWPIRTWGTSWTSRHTSAATGLPERAAQVAAPTNSSAAVVGTTVTS